jgi:hypothetical protein
MTKTALATLAAAFLATTAFTSAADAGVRVGFGFPLGSFVAHRFESQSASPNWHHSRQRSVIAAQKKRQALMAQQAKAEKMRKIHAAKLAAEKARIAAAKKKAAIETAKAEDRTEAAPAIYVPDSPSVRGTQSTPAVQTATVEPTEVVAEPVKEEIQTEPATTVQAETVEETSTTEAPAKSTVKVAERAKQVCRRFSALIGSLIDVPCK